MILLSQWYEPNDSDRLSELKAVRAHNESSGVFEKTVYLDGTSEKWAFPRLLELAGGEYRDLVCVIANTDIVFDSTASLITRACKANRLVALTRWEPPFVSPRIIGHFVDEHFFSGSQDAWAVVGGGMPEMDVFVPMGEVGCDQLVIGWAVKAGCEVFDPAMSIRTLHVHQKKNDYGNTSLGGYFGYPELVASCVGSGFALCHNWPLDDGEEPEVFSTCRP